MDNPFAMDPDEKNLALSQGLLGLGAGLLSGATGHYGAFAPALGQGMQGFNTAYQQANTNALHLKMFKQNQLLQNAQISNFNSEVEKRKFDQDELKRLQGVQGAADLFARGGAISPTQATQPSGILATPQINAPPVGPGATALAGGAGPVGGGAGYGATGSPVPGAASSVPVNPNVAANGDQVLPQVNVTGKAVSPLLDPDYWLKSSEFKRQHGDMKGALADAEQSHKLRTEELALNKDDRPKPLEGVPGITYDSKGFYEDGQPTTAAHVQDVKRGLAKAGATSVVNNLSQSAEKGYGTAFAGKVADADASLRDAAMNAPQQAERANRVLGLVNSGKVITGTGADYRLAFGKAIGLAGLSDKETISKTEALFSELASTTLDNTKTSGLGTGNGFTNQDREFLEKAKSGQIKLEAASIKRLAELNHKAAALTAKKWNDRVKMIPQSALEGTGVTRDPIEVPPMIGTDSMAPRTGALSDSEQQELDSLRKRFNK